MGTINYRKVLVVDDDRLLGYVIQAILEGEGFEVRTASDGEEGYSTCLLFRPEIVVADIWMPRKSGLEMMEQIRTQRPEIKTIYMSGELNQARLRLDEEQKKFCISILKKPFSREELTRLIFEVCGEGSAQNYQRERRKHA